MSNFCKLILALALTGSGAAAADGMSLEEIAELRQAGSVAVGPDGPRVGLVLYPGDGHGNRRAARRYDYSLRLMRWMNHYLKGDGGEQPPHQIEYGLEALTDKN